MRRTCRVCGCSDDRGCVRLGAHVGEGMRVVRQVCAWAEPDLCTACVLDASPGWVHPPAPTAMEQLLERLMAAARAQEQRIARRLADEIEGPR